MKSISFSLALIAFTLILGAWQLVGIKQVMQLEFEKQSEVTMKEEVVEVLGTYTMTFDALGAEVGFLVKTSDGLEVVRHQNGLPRTEGWEPKYITVLRDSNNHISAVVPAIVDTF